MAVDPGRSFIKREAMHKEKILSPWRARIEAAMAATRGMRVERFSTSYQSHDVETAPYHAHADQAVEIVGLFIEPNKGFDEESLPYFKGRFDDGAELVIGEEELFTDNPALQELIAAVGSGFAVARQMGYVGPYHLCDEGSEEEKRRFMREVRSFLATMEEKAAVALGKPDHPWSPGVLDRQRTERASQEAETVIFDVPLKMPPFPEGAADASKEMSAYRVARATNLLHAYHQMTSEENALDEPSHLDLACILADLRHLADHHDIDFHQALDLSYQHYLEEKPDPESARGNHGAKP